MAKNEFKKLTAKIVETYEDGSGINFIDSANLPSQNKILEILDLIIEIVFPGCKGQRKVTSSNISYVVGDIISQVKSELAEQIEKSLRFRCRLQSCPATDCHKMADDITGYLLEQLPAIRNTLKTDIHAAFAGDPAAGSLEEIVISYPGLTAITTHRIAHELYLKQVPLIPRMMSERAHHQTGIDIHPGAKIGEYFFIDHGTGIVIGETAEIGKNVKIYQGVTLGALAPAAGKSLRGVKRHPTIEDDVTIYAAATILGDVRIGRGAVIGGNVWLKDSVPADTIVSLHSPDLIYKERSKGAKAQRHKGTEKAN